MMIECSPTKGPWRAVARSGQLDIVGVDGSYVAGVGFDGDPKYLACTLADSRILAAAWTFSEIANELRALIHQPDPNDASKWMIRSGSGLAFSALMARMIATLDGMSGEPPSPPRAEEK